jgi:hypothetical protein
MAPKYTNHTAKITAANRKPTMTATPTTAAQKKMMTLQVRSTDEMGVRGGNSHRNTLNIRPSIVNKRPKSRKTTEAHVRIMEEGGVFMVIIFV